MIKISRRVKIGEVKDGQPSIGIHAGLARMIELGELRRSEKEAKAMKAGEHVSRAALSKLWVKWVRRFHPNAPHVIALKDLIILHANLKYATKQGDKYLEFVKWCIESWSAVIAQRFGWMKDNRPEYPAVRFMLKFVHIFRGAYAQRNQIEEKSKMTLRERMVYERVRNGMDEETAKRDVAEQMGDTAREKKALQQLQIQQMQREQEREMAIRTRRRKLLMSSRTDRLSNLQAEGKSMKPTKGTFGEWK